MSERPGVAVTAAQTGTMSRAASSLDVQEVITEIVIEAVSLLGGERGDIILKDVKAGVIA